MTTNNDNMHAYPAYHACHECGGDGWSWGKDSNNGHLRIICANCLGSGATHPRLSEFLSKYRQLINAGNGGNPHFVATVSGEYDCEVYAGDQYHRLRVSEIDMCWYYDIYPEPGTRASGTALHSESGEFEPCQLIDFGLFLANDDLLDDTRLPADTD